VTAEQDFPERNNRRIGRQISLPLSKAFEISWKGITIRIWRSMITISGIILAIAFLMTIWTSSAAVTALMNVPEGEKDRILADAVLQKLAIATQNVTIKIGILGPGDSGVGESKQESEAIRNILQPYSEFEPSLVPGYPKEFIRMISKYDCIVLTALSPEFATDEVAGSIVEWVKEGKTLIVYGWGRVFPENTPDTVKEAIKSVLPAVPSAETFRAQSSKLTHALHAVTQGIDWKTMPNRVFYASEPKPGAESVVKIEDKGVVWTQDLGKGHVVFVADAEPLGKKVFDWLERDDFIGRAVRWGGAEKLRRGSGTTRTTWLIVLSLLVCIVGITNAMLMSVTERFREIGTMKCLGALDVFIVKIFLIESALMGLVGTIVGIAVGFALAYARVAFSFNVEDPQTQKTVFLGLKYLPYGAIFLRMLLSLVVGVVLAITAAIYPAYTAARMEPVEAMRVEE